MVGYSYDAAGNVANDGYHSYTYDAENNLLSTDGGQTESYVRDALGREVRANSPEYNNDVELYWSPFGKLISEWNPANGSQWQGTYFWGSTPVAFYAYDGTTHFEHQDWVNTERLRTTYNGKIEATVDSLPFGDGMTVNGAWYDPPYHAFGYMYDTPSNTYQVGARTYSQTEGRWLSPDPYDGSYDLTNPQTFNRYAYALNNPLTFTDPTGMDCQDGVGMDLGQGGGDLNPCEDYNGGSGYAGNVQDNCANGCWDQNGNFYSPNGNAINGGSTTVDAGDPWDSPAGYVPTENGMGGWYGISYGVGAGEESSPPSLAGGVYSKIVRKAFSCIGETLTNNGASLLLDAAGLLVPEEGLLTVAAQTQIGALSAVSSAAGGDTTGALMNIGGIHLGVLGPAAEGAGWGAAGSILGIGKQFNRVSVGRDIANTFSDYQNCL